MGGGGGQGARAYLNSHAYFVSQQSLLTSWNLPDYLAHLEHILPTEVPRPLEVPGSGFGSSTGTEKAGVREIKTWKI